MENFDLFNRDLEIENIMFEEEDSLEEQHGSLFNLHNASAKMLVLHGCMFNLNQQLALSLEGANFKMSSSLINVSQSPGLGTFTYSKDCTIYKSLPLNTFLMTNITLIGS